MAGAWQEDFARTERAFAFDRADMEKTLAAAEKLVNRGRELASELAEVRARTAECVRASREERTTGPAGETPGAR